MSAVDTMNIKIVNGLPPPPRKKLIAKCDVVVRTQHVELINRNSRRAALMLLIIE